MNNGADSAFYQRMKSLFVSTGPCRKSNFMGCTNRFVTTSSIGESFLGVSTLRVSGQRPESPIYPTSGVAVPPCASDQVKIISK